MNPLTEIGQEGAPMLRRFAAHEASNGRGSKIMEFLKRNAHILAPGAAGAGIGYGLGGMAAHASDEEDDRHKLLAHLGLV